MTPTYRADCPNLILINADDLGYGDLGCYGSTVNKTPALDRMADEGMRFTDFYMASPVCSPSRGAMMTGCYPPRIGFADFTATWPPGTDKRCPVLWPGSPEGLNPEEISIAGILRSRGYATKIVGKWHCGDQPQFLPTRYGFDSYFGLPYSNDMGRQALRPWAPPLPLLRDEEVIQVQPDQAALTERYVAECVDFVRANHGNPFFLYLAHMHVHLPLYAAARFLRSSMNGPYGACVEAIDWSVAVLLHEVRSLGIDDNTLIIFTSDNGSRGDRGGSNHPLRGNKTTTWEGGQRVPCIMRWPGVVPAGAECREVATAMDFLPTFAGIARAEMPADRIIDGRDILPLMRSEPGARSPHEAFFYYFMRGLQAVRSGRWKLHVATASGPCCELYDLEADPSESRNVCDQHPEVVRDLQAKIETCRRDLGDSITGAVGTNCRPVGIAPDAQPLVQYEEDHPYMMAMYDLPDIG